MRISNLGGRLALLTDTGAVDIEKASAGQFSADPTAVYAKWDEFVAWAQSADLPAGTSYDDADLGAPVPEPAQIFAIGLNYRDHAIESGLDFPAEPPVFTKFRTSLAGPVGDLELPTDTVDWEAELVVVIGRAARDVSAENAWDHVAGLTVGQDFSERTRQLVPPAPQFSLGKSFPGFSPIGPAVVTLDEFADPADLDISCTVDGETMQHGRTSELIFSRSDRTTLGRSTAPARRPDLHRNAQRRRRRTQPEAVPTCGRGNRHAHRGNRGAAPKMRPRQAPHDGVRVASPER